MDTKIQDRWGNILFCFKNRQDGDRYYFDDLFLRDVYLPNSSLEGASFYNTCCENGYFYASDLYWAELSYTDFSNADLRRADLRGASAIGTVFWRCDLRGADFSADNLGGNIHFRNCDFTEMIWDEDTDFNGAFYDEHTWFPSNFCPEQKGMKKENSNLSDEVNEKRIFRFLDRHKTSFVKSHIGCTIWRYANLSHCNFSLCDAYSADFTAADLRGAVFANASLMRTSFYKADLRGSDFSRGEYSEGADLTSADLREIIWDESTNFTGILYSHDTHFPKDLNPEKWGMKQVPSIIEIQDRLK